MRRRSSAWSTIGAGPVGRPARDVGPVGVEPPLVQGRVEDAEVGRGVDADAGGPLPVAGVLREVAADEVLAEPALPAPPVDVQRLGQEAGAQHAHAVRQVAGLGQLAHAGIDQRVPGLAARPGLVVRVAAGPLERGVARVDRSLGEVRVMVQDVLVEVAPEQLGAPLARPRPLGHGRAAAHGEHPELEVRGEQGRRVGIPHVVTAGGVAGQPPVAERAQPGQPVRLAAGQPEPPAAQAERLQPRDVGRPADGSELPRQAHRARRLGVGGDDAPDRPGVRRVRPVRRAVVAHDLTRRHERLVVVQAQRHAGRAQGRGCPGVARERQRLVVAARVHLGRRRARARCAPAPRPSRRAARAGRRPARAGARRGRAGPRAGTAPARPPSPPRRRCPGRARTGRRPAAPTPRRRAGPAGRRGAGRVGTTRACRAPRRTGSQRSPAGLTAARSVARLTQTHLTSQYSSSAYCPSRGRSPTS